MSHSYQRVVCHCLGITEGKIRGAISSGSVVSVRTAMQHTSAGTGCTACHCAIKELLDGRCPQESAPSPICIAK